MNSKVTLHIFISLAAIGLKVNGGTGKKPSGVYTLLNEHLSTHAKSLNYELGEFLSGGHYGDVFFASKITNPTEGNFSGGKNLDNKKFALKIVANFKDNGSKVCEKYKKLQEIFPFGSEQLLLPFKIDVMTLDHSKIQNEDLKAIDSFCFLAMDLGLQNFDEPIFKTIGLDESNKKLNQDFILGLFGQMLLGMEELLRKGIRHNDFRDVNILLFSQRYLLPNSTLAFKYQAKLIDFDLINFNTLKNLDKNNHQVKSILADLIDNVTSTFAKIINTNKGFLFDGEKEIPLKNQKEIVEKDFPYFSELFESVETKLSKALDDFYKGIDKKTLI